MFDLSKCKLFKGYDSDLMNKYMKIQDFSEGTIIHFEGDICTEISIILEGEVDIVSYFYDGSPFIISTLDEGQIFGEILLFSTYKLYMGSVITKSKVKLATISENDLNILLASNQKVMHNFINLVCDRAFGFNTRLKLLGQKTIREKINYYISIQQAFSHEPNRIPIGESKEALASYLNIPRPSLSRELIKMKKEHLIDFDRDYIYMQNTREGEV